MTVEEIERRLGIISRKHGDDEMQHVAEDKLHQDVLRAIAEGNCANPAELAKAALESLKLYFSRWCA